MGVKSEKKRVIKMLGRLQEIPEFNENLLAQFSKNKLSDSSKEVIKSILAKKFTEFDVLEAEPVQYLAKTLSEFTKNITFNEKYQKCVLEIQNNQKQIKMANQFLAIRNSNKKKRK